jgi:hypothetical protein
MGNETNTRKVIARLEREGWLSSWWTPRQIRASFPPKRHFDCTHRELSPGVARDIAKKAGWI